MFSGVETLEPEYLTDVSSFQNIMSLLPPLLKSPEIFLNVYAEHLKIRFWVLFENTGLQLI